MKTDDNECDKNVKLDTFYIAYFDILGYKDSFKDKESSPTCEERKNGNSIFRQTLRTIC